VLPRNPFFTPSDILGLKRLSSLRFASAALGCYSGDHTDLDLFRLRRGGLGVLLPLAPAEHGPRLRLSGPPDSFLRTWSVI